MNNRDKQEIAELGNTSYKLKKFLKEEDGDSFGNLLKEYGINDGKGEYYYCNKFYEILNELNINYDWS